MTTTRQTRSPFRSGTKIEQVHDGIRALAMKRGPDAKLPTTRELCLEYSVDLTVINKALRELESSRFIYRRQGSGIYVSPKIHRKTIFVLFASDFFEADTSPFWGMLWALFAKEAQNRASFKDEDFQFHLVTPHSSEESPLPEPIMKEIEAGKVDGVLGIGTSQAAFVWLESRKTPLVTFAGPGKWEVEMNLDVATEMAVNTLVEDGCRAIGFCVPGRVDGLNKLAPFQSSIMKRGLAFNPAFVTGVVEAEGAPNMLSFQEQGLHAALRLFGNPAAPKPDGLVVIDDMLADGAIGGLEKLGIRLGEDIKIACQTNAGSPILFNYKEKLTQVEFDPKDIVHAMLHMLDEAMSGPPPAHHGQMVQLMPTLRRKNG